LIFHLDHEQRFRFCNAAYRDVAETSVRNVVGKFLWEVIGGSDDAMGPGIVRAFLGEEVTCELNLRRQMDRHFYCKFVPERNNVSVIGIFIMLTNAIKFTPDGERIKVAVSNTKSRVVVQVSDNGKGISKDFLPHIFQPFQQADMSSTRSAGGLGLGLAISHRLVDVHGGTLRAESRGPRQGAMFELSLPFSAPE